MTEATAPATETLADEATMQELVKLNEQRAATYGLLSRLYRVEVDQPLLDELRSMRFPAKTGNENVDEGYRLLATYLSNTWDNSVTDLAIDYVRVFIGHGIDAFSAAYPFESVYTSEKRLLMQEARDEVLAIYRSAGLDKQDRGRGSYRARAGIRADHGHAHGRSAAQRRRRRGRRAADHAEELLEDHLAAWAPMMTSDMKRFAQTDFYRGLAYLTDGFLQTDQTFLDDVLAED